MLKLKQIKKQDGKYVVYYETINGTECILIADTKQQAINDFFILSHFLLMKKMKKYLSLN